MSCEVKCLSSIPELEKVQKTLGFTDDDNWLNTVYVSISPTQELIAFAHGSKLVFLSKTATTTNSSYSISWIGDIPNPNEVITAIHCLPIFGYNVSYGAEWTCIAVGLCSGLVVFYTDSGIQIFSQRWSQEQVVTIRAYSKYKEDILQISYLKTICIIQENHLLSVLRSQKNYYQPTEGTIGVSTKEKSDLVVVPCKKWEYGTNGSFFVNDSAVIGAHETSNYNYIRDLAISKGTAAKPRSAPPKHSLILSGGDKPYLGFNFATESYAPVGYSDVGKEVLSKVTSSLSGWFFRSSKEKKTTVEETKEAVIPTAEKLLCRFGLCDYEREATNVWLCPFSRLAAVADNLQRVILIDCRSGTAVKILKGNRDAQCAFIKVKEKRLDSKTHVQRRTALFLVLFAPKRQCLEIWVTQNGPKIAAFNVSKYGQLIYNNHSLLGVPTDARPRYTSTSCLFLDPSDNYLKEIVIPFHCAMSSVDSVSNSKTAKDIHYLRQLKTLFRNKIAEGDEEALKPQLKEICSSIQTLDIKVICLDFMKQGKKKLSPFLFHVALDSLQSTVDEGSEFWHLLDKYLKLTEFYIRQVLDREPTPATVEMMIEDVESEEAPQLPEEEQSDISFSMNDLKLLDELLSLISESNKEDVGQNTSRVTFDDSLEKNGKNEEFFNFLSVFNISAQNVHLTLEKESVSNDLFQQFLKNDKSPDELETFLQNSKTSIISSEDFIRLLLGAWMNLDIYNFNRDEVYLYMTRLDKLLNVICTLAGDRIKYDYDEICDWWQRIREMLLECPCALRGLTFAIVCKHVSKTENVEKQEADDDDNWEQVSHEMAQWTLLIGKLEDIALLGAILGFPKTADSSVLPRITESYEKPNCSLRSLLAGSKSVVSELTANWLIHSRIDPKLIIEIEEGEQKELEPVLLNLQRLRQHFPFSLESGMILCQMTWEYMSHWSKNLHCLEYLAAGLMCLDAFRKQDQALKHGLCCLVWNAHLKIPLEATKKLINKASRLPKEKLCQQDLGISVTSVADYLNYNLIFLEKHLQSSIEFDQHKDIKCEEILNGAQHQQYQLQFLALQQNHAIKEILQIHIEMVKVLHLIAFFQLKLPKPFNYLFDAMASQTLFSEINKELQYVLPMPDMILQNQRKVFLCKAVSASVELVREDLEHLYVDDHEYYMRRIENLAAMWHLDKKRIRRHQVVQLYANGWDSYAQDLLQAITDDEKIGSLLLEIAGRRLELLSSSSQSIYLNVASIGPQLLNYLDNLREKDGGLHIIQNTSTEIQFNLLMTLTGKALQYLATKESFHLHIAGQMYDACHVLKAQQLV